MTVSHRCQKDAKAEPQIATAFDNCKWERPLLFCGRNDDTLASNIIQTVHSRGFHVMETWPGDDLCDLFKHATYLDLYKNIPKDTVLLITDIEHIDPAGRAALSEVYPVETKIICTCDDYYTPSMKTKMHRLVPYKHAIKLTKRPCRQLAWSSWTDEWTHKPWECVKKVRRRPKKFGPKQQEADQLLRQNPLVFSTLWQHAYELQTVLSTDKETSTQPYMAAAKVSNHFSACDLLRPLAEWQRKVYDDDDDPEVTHRPGDDEYTCALAMGLTCRTLPTDFKKKTEDKKRKNVTSECYTIERTKNGVTTTGMPLTYYPRFRHATAEIDDLGDDRIVINSI